MLPEFCNEPFTDFSLPENRTAMKAAIEKVRSELGKKYPIVINGERIFRDDTFKSINPGDTGQLVGEFTKGTKEDALNAIEAAASAFETWRNVDPYER
ncbi:MAG: aldehyde dehydrogenase family protein, partial [Candidatus Electryoneaceae bacterium]|nr:aldehyde dehydrogenase family protein [Candidatus Electryoneaceae bacterium]